MRPFFLSYAVTLAAMMLAFLWAGPQGLFICALMTAMEVSFSFDNAVVNAGVLKHMDETWQRRFLTWGLLVATFGMYFLSPILIVAVATGLDLFDVMHLALDQPEVYSRHLDEAHMEIASFGGMFLMMVFLSFMFNEEKKRHWLARVEHRLARLGKLEAIEIIVALVILLALQLFLPLEQRARVLAPGALGVVLYVAIHSLTSFLNMKDRRGIGYSGMMGFIYLNILDASFSLDAVVGSFAISSDIVIIVLGLTAGAMFVRSLTLYFVRKGTLEQYVFLEHGAHYAIGALSLIMLASIFWPVPEAITGLVGIALITAAFVSSVQYNKKFKA